MVYKNKDLKRKTEREYYQKNKQKVLEKKNKKCICECGGSYTNANKSKHIKSKKHKQFFSIEML